MQKKIPALMLFATISVLAAHSTYAQSGDAGLAGFVGELRDLRHPAITLDYLYGSSAAGDHITYNAYQVSAALTVFGGTHIWGSVPLRQQNGPLGSVSGIGDLTIVINQSLINLAGLDLSVDLGTKLATGSVTNGSLPQSYQNGTGSSDLLLGVDLVSSSINLGVAYELAGGRSANELTRLKRGDDFIARAGYMHHGESLDLGGEVIGIWQIQESSVLNPITQAGDYINVAGSNGLALNALFKARYNLGSMFSITGTLGIPLNKRDHNEDGLSRSLTASAGVALSF
ncbi:MAG: hypothetical protein Q8916_12000 [Bacteroidota bacterium]|nr:hypothetical protein [Bacteroidota bacterium]MDP4231114.1 hypothetical protein [Bacteroidota bacterium]MDP4235753.1 hypothetical protein [Bacteroidota bacterium]